MKLTYQEISHLFPDHSLNFDLLEFVTGISKDTRTLQPGDLYVAIKGDQFDGHDFLDQAFAKGAKAALVSDLLLKGENLIRVPDTLKVIQNLATYYRQKFEQPVVAITGSSGKTTVKDMLNHVLSGTKSVVATKGNLNNHIGVPFTIFTFNDEADVFIVEMGMSAAGEIAELTKIADPDVATITSIGAAHVEAFEDGLQGVIRAKGELFDGLKEGALAIVSLDYQGLENLPTKADRIFVGIDQQNAHVVGTDVRIIQETGETVFNLKFKHNEYEVVIPLSGRHHVSNALIVFAVAMSLGLSAEEIISRLSSFEPAQNRGALLNFKNVRVLNDSYNANPSSVQAAMQGFCGRFKKSYKVAVLGDMLELGSVSGACHRQVGQLAKEIGFDEMLAYGSESKKTLEGFGYTGSEIESHHYASHQELAIDLEGLARKKEGTVVLLKGSRGMTMEKVLEHLEK